MPAPPWNRFARGSCNHSVGLAKTQSWPPFYVEIGFWVGMGWILLFVGGHGWVLFLGGYGWE
jgi:hypothetical protein